MSLRTEAGPQQCSQCSEIASQYQRTRKCDTPGKKGKKPIFRNHRKAESHQGEAGNTGTERHNLGCRHNHSNDHTRQRHHIEPKSLDQQGQSRAYQTVNAPGGRSIASPCTSFLRGICRCASVNRKRETDCSPRLQSDPAALLYQRDRGDYPLSISPDGSTFIRWRYTRRSRHTPDNLTRNNPNG